MQVKTERGRKTRRTRHHSASPHLTLFLGLPLLPVEVLGGTGLLVPRGSLTPPPFVQYLKIDPALLLLFFLLLLDGEARAGAVAGSPASAASAAMVDAVAVEAAALAVEGVVVAAAAGGAEDVVLGVGAAASAMTGGAAVVAA